jgi:hypothetical protein
MIAASQLSCVRVVGAWLAVVTNDVAVCFSLIGGARIGFAVAAAFPTVYADHKTLQGPQDLTCLPPKRGLIPAQPIN